MFNITNNVISAFPPTTVDGTGLPTNHRRRYRPPHRLSTVGGRDYSRLPGLVSYHTCSSLISAITASLVSRRCVAAGRFACRRRIVVNRQLLHKYLKIDHHRRQTSLSQLISSILIQTWVRRSNMTIFDQSSSKKVEIFFIHDFSSDICKIK